MASQDSITASTDIPTAIMTFNAKENLAALQHMLAKVIIRTKLAQKYNCTNIISDPAAQPQVWVTKWVDYSEKYGFGYQLSDDTVGLLFNDTTILVMLPDRKNVQYVDADGEESVMAINRYPAVLDTKLRVLSLFRNYMRDNLLGVQQESNILSRISHLYQWVRFTSGLLMQLDNGTVQVHFIDHTKVLVCPLMAAITLIDKDRTLQTFRFSSIEKNGCSVQLYVRMRYAFEMISMILDMGK